MDYWKLIELAIKYDREKEGASFDWNITNGEFENHIYQKYLISKEYGFIKWLVDNDKIDREKFGNSETKSSKYSDFELSYDTPREDYTNILLMELSISDTPIEDLLLYLK